jgi:hypothetical protein
MFGSMITPSPIQEQFGGKTILIIGDTATPVRGCSPICKTIVHTTMFGSTKNDDRYCNHTRKEE